MVIAPSADELDLKISKLRQDLSNLPPCTEEWMCELIRKGLNYEEPQDWQPKYTLNFYEGKDIFLTLRTGGGKSALLHAPILARMVMMQPHIGITVVPMRSLMDDQVSVLV